MSCVGCLDQKACNFDSTLALHDESMCVFRKPFHDCNGRCEREIDCEGTCGGIKTVDKCGVCGGDSTSCDFGLLEKSMEEATRRDEAAREARRVASAKQRTQIGQLEAQVAALTAALGDNDPTGAIEMLRTTITTMKQELSEVEATNADASDESLTLNHTSDNNACSANDCHGYARDHVKNEFPQPLCLLYDRALHHLCCVRYSCDQWILSFQTSCAVLEQDFACSCDGCRGCAGAGAGTHRGSIDESAIAAFAVKGGEASVSSMDEHLPDGWFSAIDAGSGRQYVFAWLGTKLSCSTVGLLTLTNLLTH